MPMDFPKATLSNGLVVANLGSPHSFIFDDGTVLDAADDELVEKSKFEYKEVEKEGIGGTTDLLLTPCMTVESALLIKEIQHDDSIDVVIVPRSFLEAMKSAGIKIGKCRTIRLADRKTKICCSNKFCII